MRAIEPWCTLAGVQRSPPENTCKGQSIASPFVLVRSRIPFLPFTSHKPCSTKATCRLIRIPKATYSTAVLDTSVGQTSAKCRILHAPTEWRHGVGSISTSSTPSFFLFFIFFFNLHQVLLFFLILQHLIYIIFF